MLRQAFDIANAISDTKLKDLIKSLGGRVPSVPRAISSNPEAKAAQRATLLTKTIELLRERYQNDFNEIVAYLEKESKGKKKKKAQNFGIFNDIIDAILGNNAE
jgi:hypothetical protein